MVELVAEVALIGRGVVCAKHSRSREGFGITMSMRNEVDDWGHSLDRMWNFFAVVSYGNRGLFR